MREKNSTDVLEVTLPDDETAALHKVLEHYMRLTNRRRWNATSLNELIKNAKARGKNPKSTRLAIKLGKMTPEKRMEWEQEMREAASLYGIRIEYDEDVTRVDEEIDDIKSKERYFSDERKEITLELKALSDAAKAHNIDMQTVKLLAKVKFVNDEGHGDEAENFFTRLDSYGAKVGLW